MILPKVINDFYGSLNELDLIGKGIDVKIDNLSDILRDFDLKIKKVDIDDSLKKENDEIAKIFDSSTKAIKNSISTMIINMDEYLKKDKFREEFPDSFIVIIYGKVKAGKSTLGNFISSQSNLQEKAKFFVYDQAGKIKETKKLEEIEEDNFKTDNLECTSSIQVFRLGKLVWVDTPGLGSMTEENGQLAKDYINKADYIVFPTSSAQPLQSDEIKEIEELLEQNKELTLCITRSDDIAIFEDENGDVVIDEDGNIKQITINKTKDNRELQEKNARERLKENIDNSEKIDDIFSISVICAKNGLETKDKELFKNSNIDIFYTKMLDIVKNKSKKLKEETPYKTLIGFVDTRLLKEIEKEDGIKSQIKILKNKVSEISDNLDSQKSDILTEITIVMNSIVSKYAMQINTDNSKTIFDKVDKEFTEEIEILVTTAIQTTLKEFTKSVNSFTTNLEDNSSFEIKEQYETISVSYDDSGFFRKLLNKFGIMELSYETIKEEVNVGNNKEQILLKYKQDRVSKFEMEVNNTFQSIQNNYFDKLKNSILTIENNILDFNNNINNFKNSLEKGNK